MGVTTSTANAGATYTPIATYTVPSAAATVTLSSISSAYTDLILVIGGLTSSADPSVMAQFNGDTGTNYSCTYVYGDGSQALSGRASNQTKAVVGRLGNGQSNTIAQFQNYSNTTTSKTVISRGNNPTGLVLTTASLWRATPAAISSMVLSLDTGGNFSTGSTFTLYGIRAA